MFVAATGDVPPSHDLPPEIQVKIERMQSAMVMPSAWQKRDAWKTAGPDPFFWPRRCTSSTTNALVTEGGLLPMVAMVLDQNPRQAVPADS